MIGVRATQWTGWRDPVKFRLRASLLPIGTSIWGNTSMNRREFLEAGSVAAGAALSTVGKRAAGYTSRDAKRVGLIGCGWYGKSDLIRLIQVAPVEVVSLCDVDKKMLADAAETIANRQPSKKTPRTYADYREMLS